MIPLLVGSQHGAIRAFLHGFASTVAVVTVVFCVAAVRRSFLR